MASAGADETRDGKLLFEGSDWSFDTLERTYAAIEEVALGDLGLDVYPNQIEIISSEQMLDAYSSIGMPLMYQHWSFGKHFVRERTLYEKGYTDLAYEIVINSNPCISYNMEENTMALQALVMAHAAFGHNHFFKNNYLFRQWTDAEAILEYLQFAKSYITKCEERHVMNPVEEILDSAHAIMDYGVFRSRRPPKLSKDQPGPGTLAAGVIAHRAQRRPVLLSAKADQGDERGLRVFRSPHDRQSAFRKGPD